MKKLGGLCILLTIISVVFAPAYGQSLRIGFGGGLSSVQTPDIYTKDISTGGYGISREYNLGIKAKLKFPLLPLTPYGFVLYHSLNGSAQSSIGEIKYTQNILSYGVGFELLFIPVPSPIKPYFSLNAALNNFGELKREAPLLEGGNFTVASKSRFGGGIGFGADINLLLLKLDLSAHYNFMNLIGKNNDEEAINIITFDVFLVF